MAAGTLYTYPENFRAFKALIAAQYAGANIKVQPDFVFGETNKTEAFLKKFPTGKVPAFESADGKVLLTESNAIAYYVSNAALRGSDAVSSSQVLQWLGWADGEVLPPSCAWVFPLLGIMQYNKQTVERAKEDIKTALTYLNKHLLTRTFLVGERISLADISVFCTLLHVYQNVLEPSVRQPFTNVNRWFVTLLNQPQFRAVLGDSVKLCETAIVFDPKKVPEAAKSQQQQQQKPKKEKKEKAPQVKKEVEVKVEEELDASEEALAAEPPSKDPFSALPKGTFVMDDFKKVYSNESEAVSIPYFFAKFDPENYSIWFAEYKYNVELAKTFMSCNLVSGMYQRLEKLNKNAFASVCIFGEDNNNSISGVWVWRGQELAFPLSPDWQTDYESYSWTKLDFSSDATKKIVEQYFSWLGTDKQGRKFNQGKIFK